MKKENTFDIETIRKEFPILSTRVNGAPLVYLDNAATTHMPSRVLDKYIEHYHLSHANVHRGVHSLSAKSTRNYEEAREKVACFINAANPDSIIFTKGTTEAINTVAHGLEHLLKPHDRVVVSAMEHHSNFVPWQQLCKKTGARLHIVGLTESGDIDLHALRTCLQQPAKIVAMTCCSNVLGTMTPVEEIITLAHAAGALCLLDGAQVMRHRIADMQAWGCDFFCFSGHKMMGPTGIGVLYAAPEALPMLNPIEFGGEMVNQVTAGYTTFASAPLCFEAGTPNFVGAIMLGHAIDFIQQCGREEIWLYEDFLLDQAELLLHEIDGIKILGNPQRRCGSISFVFDDVHPFDLCLLLDQMGIALRSGNNCAQPLLHDVYGVKSVTRLSVAFYNSISDIERAVEAIKKTLPLVKQ